MHYGKDTAVKKLKSAYVKGLKYFLTFINIVVLSICFYSWACQLSAPSIIMLSGVFINVKNSVITSLYA